jgi:hypothetical protein
MRLLLRRRATLLALAGAFQLVAAVPAHATGVFVVNAEMLAMLQVVGSQNVCLTYSYDHNGNRLSRNSQTFAATGTWGSSVFGCFIWTS